MSDQTNKFSTQLVVPWLSLVISFVALAVAITAHDTNEKPVSPHGTNPLPANTSPFALPLGSAGSAPNMPANEMKGTPPDLSKMSPKEIADRLFNRIMMASENNNVKEALVFVPMAVETYKKMEPLDNDARYHLALIHLVASDEKNTLVQLAKLRQSAPRHLLGYMLEFQIAERNQNQQGMDRAYKNFLAAYETEFLKDRVEYKDHQGSIDRFRKRAQAGGAIKK